MEGVPDAKECILGLSWAWDAGISRRWVTQGSQQGRIPTFLSLLPQMGKFQRQPPSQTLFLKSV